MRIEVSEQQSGLNGGQEVWVQVLSNEVKDWPTIETMLSDEQKAILKGLGNRKLARYIPHHPTAEEREEHGQSFEDWFVWERA